MIDERGTKVRDWANAQKHVIERCSFQPVQSSTNWTDPRQAVTVKASLYLPPGSDIAEEDMVEFGGAKYAVEGAPFEWRSRRAALTTCRHRLSIGGGSNGRQGAHRA